MAHGLLSAPRSKTQTIKSQNVHVNYQFYFPGDENSTRQTGQVTCDFHSSDVLDTRIGEWASANFQPWDILQDLGWDTLEQRRSKQLIISVFKSLS